MDRRHPHVPLVRRVHRPVEGGEAGPEPDREGALGAGVPGTEDAVVHPPGGLLVHGGHLGLAPDGWGKGKLIIF